MGGLSRTEGRDGHGVEAERVDLGAVGGAGRARRRGGVRAEPGGSLTRRRGLVPGILQTTGSAEILARVPAVGVEGSSGSFCWQVVRVVFATTAVWFTLGI